MTGKTMTEPPAITLTTITLTTITTMTMTVENMVSYLRHGGMEIPEGRVRFELYDDDNAGHQMVVMSWTHQ